MSKLKVLSYKRILSKIFGTILVSKSSAFSTILLKAFSSRFLLLVEVTFAVDRTVKVVLKSIAIIYSYGRKIETIRR